VTEHDNDPAWDEEYDDGPGAGPAGAGTWTLENLPDAVAVPGAQPPADDDWQASPDGTRILPADGDGELDGRPPDQAAPAPGRTGHAPGKTIRRSPRRLLAVTAPVLVCIAALAYAVAPGSNPVSIVPADNPAATVPAPSATGAPSPSPVSTTLASPVPTVPATATPAATAADPPVISKTAAENVLAAFWTGNNTANQARSSTLLGDIETGSSYALDTGQYRASLAEDPASSHYTPFDAMNAVYYIPRQAPGTYPIWWAARVTYANLSSPQHATSAGYMIFTQAAADAPWDDTLEPYFWTGSAPAPFIPADTDGYASQLDPSGTAGLSIAPDQIPALTAGSLDGTSSAITTPANLADLYEQSAIEGEVPAGTKVTDTHSAAGPVYTLQAVGGVLTFFSLTAQLSVNAPQDQSIHGISIPGYRSPDQSFTFAAFTYTDQFAVFIPDGSGSPTVVADASGITGQG
jgi:hypothetical protein